MGCGKNKFESSSRENMVSDAGCICEVVQTILSLQNQAVRNDDTCGSSCFIEPIGGLTKHGHADTRVFMLLDHLGRPFKVVARFNDCYTYTPFFRVEDVFGDCCATLRCIVAVDEDGAVDLFDEDPNVMNPDAFEDIEKFKKTETCVTVDLNNFTAIQCIADVDLNIHHH